MTHTFNVGKYKIECGGEAVVLEVGPDGNLYGRQFTGGSWYSSTWSPDGSSRMFGGTRDWDILPPKRQIWIAVWQYPRGDNAHTTALASEALAEACTCIGARTRIAVLGPIDVEAEP